MKYAAILGYGTVGSGVAQILDENARVIRNRAGEDIAVRYILVRRDYPDSPYRDRFVTDFSVIENDPEVSLVAECLGGVGAALDYDRRALQAGKSVITPNKELVAAHGRELLRLAREKGVSFLFEASVGGGIPVLHPLTLCLAANRIREVTGIVNGTTNYILTAMRESGASFAGALAEAQRLGYAEADPTADVEGLDAGRKACILADLCFGRNVDPAGVPMTGITAVAAEDVSAAEALGYRIKLLGRAVRTGDRAAVWAAPHLVSGSSPLYQVEGVTNGILLQGDAVGETFLRGPGAGRLPTASAVAGDLIDAAQCAGRPRYLEWDEAPEGYLADPETLEARWFIRAGADWARISERFPGAEPAPGRADAFLTPPMSGLEARRLAQPLQPASVLRVLD